MNETGIAEADITTIAKWIEEHTEHISDANTSKEDSNPLSVRIIHCVLSLNRKYEEFVAPRLKTFKDKHPEIQHVEDLAQFITSYSTPHAFMHEELNFNYEDRANTLQSVVEFVCKIVEEMPNVPEEDVLKQWAIQASPQDYQKLNIRGFGIAGFQYLRMLFGADTIKPDIHIIRFASKILERNVTDIESILLLEAAAKHIGLSARAVDRYIWKRGSQSSKHKPCTS